MQVLAHRGLWPAGGDANSEGAFRAAADAGFGLEIDIRDLGGDLVVSHDPARPGALPLGKLLVGLADVPLALNIKADGLGTLVASELQRWSGTWFLFDFSVPDLVVALRLGLPAFTRQSEHEPEPALLEQCGGVWIDAFTRDWIDEATVAGHLEAGRAACLVSSELHGRDHRPVWEAWTAWDLWSHDRLFLCTDHPHEAMEALAR